MEENNNKEFEVYELDEWPDEMELISYDLDDFPDDLPEMDIINHNLDPIGD